jgi:hypothetical protein
MKEKQVWLGMVKYAEADFMIQMMGQYGACVSVRRVNHFSIIFKCLFGTPSCFWWI